MPQPFTLQELDALLARQQHVLDGVIRALNHGPHIPDEGILLLQKIERIQVGVDALFSLLVQKKLVLPAEAAGVLITVIYNHCQALGGGAPVLGGMSHEDFLRLQETLLKGARHEDSGVRVPAVSSGSAPGAGNGNSSGIDTAAV